MSEQPIIVERVPVEGFGEKMIITLNRPERVNAFTEPMFLGLNAALDEAEQDDAIRVIILRGAGQKGFCSGLDRVEMGRLRDEGREMAIFDYIYGTAKRIDAFPKPVISLIHGHTIAAGGQLASSADLIIAAENLRMVEPEMRMTGFNDDSWAMRMGRIMGPVRAKRYVLLAEPISGKEAVELGLVSMVVPDAELDVVGNRIADQIASYLPNVVTKTLALIDRGSGKNG